LKYVDADINYNFINVDISPISIGIDKFLLTSIERHRCHRSIFYCCW